MKVKTIIPALILCGAFQQCLLAADKEKAAQPTTPPAGTKHGPILITSPQDAWKKGLITEYQLEKIREAERTQVLNNRLNTPSK
jgi:hypothetical protein